jgi:hypothetical protein
VIASTIQIIAGCEPSLSFQINNRELNRAYSQRPSGKEYCNQAGRFFELKSGNTFIKGSMEEIPLQKI